MATEQPKHFSKELAKKFQNPLSTPAVLEITYPEMLLTYPSGDKSIDTQIDTAKHELELMQNLPSTVLLTTTDLLSDLFWNTLKDSGITHIGTFGTIEQTYTYLSASRKSIKTSTDLEAMTYLDIQELLAAEIGAQPNMNGVEVFSDCLDYSSEMVRKGNSNIKPAFIFIVPPKVLETRKRKKTPMGFYDNNITVTELVYGVLQLKKICDEFDETNPELIDLLPPVIFALSQATDYPEK